MKFAALIASLLLCGCAEQQLAPNSGGSASPAGSASQSASAPSSDPSITLPKFKAPAADSTPTYGDRVWVDGYYRNNGTYVKGHWRRK